MDRTQFASDNVAGMCPDALKYLMLANEANESPYGHDRWSDKARAAICDLFGKQCTCFFVFTGTAANSLALASLCQSYHSVVCSEFAHIETDECGGPEYASNGAKLLLAPSQMGKLVTGALKRFVQRRTDIHFPKPKVLSISQSTELGTVYGVDELVELTGIAKELGLFVHMDGARFANAVASLNCHPSEISWKAGIDVLCFSGTKNGLAFGEAIIFFDSALAQDFAYRLKQAGQLGSKARFLASPWLGLLESGAWLKNATNANFMAKDLASRLGQFEGIRVKYPVDANAVFVDMPNWLDRSLKLLGWKYYMFIADGGARLMCNWSTHSSAIDQFLSDVTQCYEASGQ